MRKKFISWRKALNATQGTQDLASSRRVARDGGRKLVPSSKASLKPRPTLTRGNNLERDVYLNSIPNIDALQTPTRLAHVRYYTSPTYNDTQTGQGTCAAPSLGRARC